MSTSDLYSRRTRPARMLASESQRFTLLFFTGCALFFTGCATHADRLRDARREFYSGNIAGAETLIDVEIARDKNDVDVLRLEKAMILLAAGKPAEASRELRAVRDSFDHLEEHNTAEHALAMLSDDQTLAYAGEDYEKVLLRAMLAITSLVSDGGDAMAYALQVQQKQQQIIEAEPVLEGENPRANYRQLALGPYLQGVIAEQTHRDYDVAARSYFQVASWQPEFRPAHSDVQRAQYGRHSAPGNGVLYVFAMVGRGPRKEEKMEIPTTVALILAEHILRAAGMKKMPPSIAPVKVPCLVHSNCAVESIEVAIDGRPAGSTETITNISQMATDQFEAVYPSILARAVARRVIKKAAIYSAKEALDDNLLGILLDIGNICWDFTESADTRCWGLLPSKIQVLRLELPSGTHRIALSPAGRALSTANTHTAEVCIRDGENAYLLGNFPDRGLVGELLCNARPTAAPAAPLAQPLPSVVLQPPVKDSVRPKSPEKEQLLAPHRRQ